MNTRSITMPAPVAGAGLAPLWQAVRRQAASVWSALERQGQRRAARELALYAASIELTRPELAQELRGMARHWRAQ